ncbi:hypothetical protein MKW92_011319 [Papaver armeniacum]|nr:hypothetical protein MKW92_011319 [Papaver armeniacum]
MEGVVVTSTNILFSTSSPLKNNKKSATNLKFLSPSSSSNCKKISCQASKIKSSRSSSSTDAGGGGGKMDEYNTAMKKMMRNPYEYHHDLGMNYKLILDNLIVGSQPQKPEDIDHLRKEMNVAYILNLQQDKDAKDFDGDSLRIGLPKAVSSLEWAIEEGKGRKAIRAATYDLAKNDPWKEPFENLPENAFEDIAPWERKLIQDRVRALRGT